MVSEELVFNMVEQKNSLKNSIGYVRSEWCHDLKTPAINWSVHDGFARKLSSDLKLIMCY